MLVTALVLILLLGAVFLMMKLVKRRQRSDTRREQEAESPVQNVLVKAKDNLIATSHDLCRELDMLRSGRGGKHEE